MARRYTLRLSCQNVNLSFERLDPKKDKKGSRGCGRYTMATVSYETCPTSAPFFGFMGAAAALVFGSKCFFSELDEIPGGLVCCEWDGDVSVLVCVPLAEY